MQWIPFLTIFAPLAGTLAAAKAADWQVEGVELDSQTRTMRVRVCCAALPDESTRRLVEETLAERFGLNLAEVRVRVEDAVPPEEEIPLPEAPPEEVPSSEPPEDIPDPAPAPEQKAQVDDPFRRTEELRKAAMKSVLQGPMKEKKGEKKRSGRLIYGLHPIKKDPIPISELVLDMGTVVVKGDVFSVDHRELKKRGAWVVSFDITDYTGSVRVNKFFPGEEGKA